MRKSRKSRRCFTTAFNNNALLLEVDVVFLDTLSTLEDILDVADT